MHGPPPAPHQPDPPPGQAQRQADPPPKQAPRRPAQQPWQAPHHNPRRTIGDRSMIEPLQVTEGLQVGAATPLEDSLNWRINWQVAKYADDAAFAAGQPYEVNDIPGNLLTTAGIGRIATLLTAGTGNLISST